VTLVPVGRVGRRHGRDGSFVVEEASEERGRFDPGKRLCLRDGERAEIVASKMAGGRPVIRLDRVVERGAELSVPASDLPPPEPGSFYVFQLVGLAVEEEGGRLLGRVAAVAPGVANDVVELDTGVTLPLVDECVRRVDLDVGRIEVAPGFADWG
jgi:16S rRNA processing protein RimM